MVLSFQILVKNILLVFVGIASYILRKFPLLVVLQTYTVASSGLNPHIM